MNASGRTKVALVDQHALLTDCLASTLERVGYDTRIVLMPPPPLAVTFERAAREVRSFTPRVVILSCDHGPNGRSEQLLALLAGTGAPVIVLAEEDDDALWGGYVARGARAVVPMTASLASMCAVVRLLADGMPVMSQAVRERLVAAHRAQSGAHRRERERLAKLSPHEAEILRLLMAGCSPAEVARSRVVSVATVRTQVRWILSKLEVSSQLAAVATAHRAGWSAHQVASTADIPEPVSGAPGVRRPPT